MAWVKIPPDHHPIFRAALPNDRRIATIKMFGAVAALVNGNLFGGLFGRSFMVKLAERDQAEALALDGAEPFDPMGNGRVMSNSVFMPEETFGEDAELKAWLRRAFDHALTLPPKVKKPAAKAKPAKRGAKAAARNTRKAKSKAVATKTRAAKAKSSAAATKTRAAKAKSKAAATKTRSAAKTKPKRTRR